MTCSMNNVDEIELLSLAKLHDLRNKTFFSVYKMHILKLREVLG